MARSTRSTRSTRAIAAAALAAALAVPGFPSARSADAAVPSCEGLPASIVGIADRPVDGTSGDDVIVTNGASSVSAGDGNDRVCVTGANDHHSAFVDAGAGDDLVDGTQSTLLRLSALLGDGDDVFRGGPEADDVREFDDDSRRVSSGRDLVVTGAGDDDVVVGLSGSGVVDRVPEPARDRVDLGEGDDELRVANEVAPGFSAVAGTGSDSITVEDLRTRGWSMDNVLGLLRRPGQDYLVRSFEDLDLYLLDVSFRGGPATEEVTLMEAAGAITLGSGDDALSIDRWTGSAVVVGGPGHDRIWMEQLPLTRATLDVRRGRLSDDGGIRGDLAVSGLEQYVVGVKRRLTFVGTRGADDLAVSACLVRGDSRGGDDRLEAWVNGESSCSRPVARFKGGPGDDRLYAARGRGGNDRLIGGRGHDLADGQGGRDLCRAEVRRHCERR